MSVHDDRDLRDRFASLRRSDADRTPGFSPPRHAAGAAPRPWRRVALLAGTAAAVATVALLPWRRDVPPLEDAIAEAEALASWTAPTDAWLSIADLSIPDAIPTLELDSASVTSEAEDGETTGDSP